MVFFLRGSSDEVSIAGRHTGIYMFFVLLLHGWRFFFFKSRPGWLGTGWDVGMRCLGWRFGPHMAMFGVGIVWYGWDGGGDRMVMVDV